MKIKILIFSLILLGVLGSGMVAAQDSAVCEQNAAYWEHWQANADFRVRMTGDMWNVTFFDVSPDGNTLAVTNRNSLALYDAQTLTPQKQLASMNARSAGGYPGSYRGVNWSPDGSQLAAAYYVDDSPDNPNPVNGIQIWDVERGEQVDFLASRPNVIAWSPDSSMLAEVDFFYREIWLWDVARSLSSKLYEHEPVHSFYADGLSWSPNGHYVAAFKDAGGLLRLFTPGEAESQLIESPELEIGYVTWSPDSKQIVMGNRLAHNLFMVDVNTGEITRTLNGGDGNPLDLQWSPDGAWLARGTPHGLYLWDMTSDDTTSARVFDEHMPPFVRMAWTPDSKALISVDFEGSLYRWDVETGCVEAALLKIWEPR
jgi:WD40 repeat protein